MSVGVTKDYKLSVVSRLGCLEGKFFSSPNILFSSRREMETGREEIDPFEGINDPTLRVQMQHMRAIEELVFVTKLSFVPAHKDKAEGFRATLSVRSLQVV
jgi:hypothetical protein